MFKMDATCCEPTQQKGGKLQELYKKGFKTTVTYCRGIFSGDSFPKRNRSSVRKDLIEACHRVVHELTAESVPTYEEGAHLSALLELPPSAMYELAEKVRSGEVLPRSAGVSRQVEDLAAEAIISNFVLGKGSLDIIEICRGGRSGNVSADSTHPASLGSVEIKWDGRVSLYGLVGEEDVTEVMKAFIVGDKVPMMQFEVVEACKVCECVAQFVCDVFSAAGAKHHLGGDKSEFLPMLRIQGSKEVRNNYYLGQDRKLPAGKGGICDSLHGGVVVDNGVPRAEIEWPGPAIWKTNRCYARCVGCDDAFIGSASQWCPGASIVRWKGICRRSDSMSDIRKAATNWKLARSGVRAVIVVRPRTCDKRFARACAVSHLQEEPAGIRGAGEVRAQQLREEMAGVCLELVLCQAAVEAGTITVALHPTQPVRLCGRFSLADWCGKMLKDYEVKASIGKDCVAVRLGDPEFPGHGCSSRTRSDLAFGKKVSMKTERAIEGRELTGLEHDVCAKLTWEGSSVAIEHQGRQRAAPREHRKMVGREEEEASMYCEGSRCRGPPDADDTQPSVKDSSRAAEREVEVPMVRLYRPPSCGSVFAECGTVCGACSKEGFSIADARAAGLARAQRHTMVWEPSGTYKAVRAVEDGLTSEQLDLIAKNKIAKWRKTAKRAAEVGATRLASSGRLR